MAADTFTSAVNRYVKKYSSLQETHFVLIIALKKVAAQLDSSLTVSMVGEYVKIVRMLEAARKESEGPDADNEDDLLSPMA